MGLGKITGLTFFVTLTGLPFQIKEGVTFLDFNYQPFPEPILCVNWLDVTLFWCEVVGLILHIHKGGGG